MHSHFNANCYSKIFYVHLKLVSDEGAYWRDIFFARKTPCRNIKRIWHLATVSKNFDKGVIMGICENFFLQFEVYEQYLAEKFSCRKYQILMMFLQSV